MVVLAQLSPTFVHLKARRNRWKLKQNLQWSMLSKRKQTSNKTNMIIYRKRAIST
nr:MAG TPA: hypothetical protein [Caudoviricetes sp.]